MPTDKQFYYVRAVHGYLLVVSVGLGYLGATNLKAQENRNLPYRELEGTVEDFQYSHQWHHYYWREDFTMLVRDGQGKKHRVISREPTPWNDLRLGTTYTGLEVDWNAKPSVKLIGVQGVDRIPADFHDLKLDPSETLTAFIVKVRSKKNDPWREYYVNNWFHDWSPAADRNVLPHYANDDPNYSVYGFLGSIAAPFDATGRQLLAHYEPEYGGIIYHGRVVKAENDIGYAVRILHLMGRHKKSNEYKIFHGDPATLIRLDGHKPRFIDVTEKSGIKIADNTDVGGTNPHCVAVEDFDSDGLLDILITTFGAPHVRYFRNKGKLKFEDVTRGSGLESFTGEGTGAAVADFDHNGTLDVYLTALGNGASRLYSGRGDGTFVDVSREAGVLLDHPMRSCAWSDIDHDGWVDLYVTCPRGKNRLFHNNRDGTFTDIADEAGVALSDKHSLGCAFGDIDGDGLEDLFVTNYESQSSALFQNLGSGKFRDITIAAGLDRKASAVGCMFADIFNRNRLDLFVTTDSWLSGINATESELLKQGKTVEPNELYENKGQGRFGPINTTTLQHKSVSHDVVLEDFDHDGRVDIYVAVDAIPTGNHFATHKGGNPLWTRRDGGSWLDVRGEWGVDYQGNCVAVPAADFDNDGDLDLLLVNFYSNVVLYRNETNDKNYLRVKAIGTTSNPDGIGARVSVFAERPTSNTFIGSRHIQSGAGYCRSSPLEAHFGLGQNPVDKYRVEVFFPATKKLAVKEHVRAGQQIVAREDEP